MIVDERMVTYINSLDEGHTAYLEELEAQAKQDHVPIIRREMQSFLKFLLAAVRPVRIKKVGTAVGFSALLMCEYNPVVDYYRRKLRKRIPIAEEFQKAGRPAR